MDVCVNHPDRPSHRIGPRGGLCDPCYREFMAKKGMPVDRPVVHQSTESLRELAETARENVADIVDAELGVVSPLRARKLATENGKISTERCPRNSTCPKPKGHSGRCPVARPPIDRPVVPDQRFNKNNPDAAKAAIAARTGTAKGTTGLKDGPVKRVEKASAVGHRGGGELGRGKSDKKMYCGLDLTPLYEALVEQRDTAIKGIEAIETLARFNEADAKDGR